VPTRYAAQARLAVPTRRRAAACRRGSRAVSDRAMARPAAHDTAHGPFGRAVPPMGHDSFAVPRRSIARQHKNTSPFTRIIMKQNL
jgi:hypothetical protein